MVCCLRVFLPSTDMITSKTIFNNCPQSSSSDPARPPKLSDRIGAIAEALGAAKCDGQLPLSTTLK